MYDGRQIQLAIGTRGGGGSRPAPDDDGVHLILRHVFLQRAGAMVWLSAHTTGGRYRRAWLGLECTGRTFVSWGGCGFTLLSPFLFHAPPLLIVAHGVNID